ncbi:hypothetical protein [Nonomuraea sp. LPB2021202275-12-8]|uniref:hypothetical protein n=1 Tax=Nonomuraea sp. LPB2021202275-12-8 TaxID=3120159 RepID=UPI00300CE123
MTAELAALLELVSSARPRVEDVVVGHGRDATAEAEAFVRAWPGAVLAVVDWPEEAASWLRLGRNLIHREGP